MNKDTLEKYLTELVQGALEGVQTLLEDEDQEMLDEYKEWASNWLLNIGDARQINRIGGVVMSLELYREKTDKTTYRYDAAEWAATSALFAAKSLRHFDQGDTDRLMYSAHNAIACAVYSSLLSNLRGRGVIEEKIKEFTLEVALPYNCLNQNWR